MVNSNSPHLVILAWGNASRGDDAVGPIMAEKLTDLELDELVVIEDLQLNIEHLLDLQSHIPVLFVDASCQPNQGYCLKKISAEADNSISTHSVSPTALLNLFEKTLRKPAPAAYMLEISGSQFELGQAISPGTQSAIEQSWKFLQQLLSKPCQSWHSQLEIACGENI